MQFKVVQCVTSDSNSPNIKNKVLKWCNVCCQSRLASTDMNTVRADYGFCLISRKYINQMVDLGNGRPGTLTAIISLLLLSSGEREREIKE